MFDDVLRALPSIYDAAINSERWGAALDTTIPIVGAKQGGLLVSDLRESEPFSFSQHSAVYRSPSGKRKLQFYMENLVCWETEGWEIIRTLPKHSVIRDTDIWPDLDALQSRPDARFLQKEFCCFRRIAARLNDNRCWFDTLSLQYDSALATVPEGNITAIQTLLPHIAKAVEIGRAFTLLRERYQAVLTALDHVQIGMCLALDRGDVIVANSEAQRIFDLNDGIKLGRDQKILCRDPDIGQQIAEAVRVAAQTVRGENDAAEALLAVPRFSEEQPLLIEIAPLRDEHGEVEIGLEGALVMIIDPGNPRPFSTAKAAEAYHLTPAEAEVCRYLIDGWTNARIAEERRVTIDTVKTQIASILQKTATKRRSELIRLVLKSSPPVAMPAAQF